MKITTNTKLNTSFRASGKQTSKSIIEQMLESEIEVAQEQEVIPVPGSNSFVGTALLAYSQHVGLVLNPDDVWVTILQGISKHIQENAETLRGFFVSHEGQETLELYRPDFTDIVSFPWPEVFEEFQILLRKKAHHVDKLVSNFSTTTDLSRAVSNLTVMDSLKSYFVYKVMTMCGVPFYTLEGTTSDWHEIYSRTNFLLKEMGFENWRRKILPTLEEFVKASEGNSSEYFWKSFVKEENGSGGSRISGHISSLIPYQVCHGESFLVKRSINSSNLPCSLTKTPFELDATPMNFIGGFAGAIFNEAETSVRPAMTWAVSK